MEISLLSKLIKDELAELKASELTEINVKDQTSVTDLIIICNGRGNRHVKSLANNLVLKLKKLKQKPLSTSGVDGGEWVLVDCGDIIVHIMLAEVRAFYNLEGMWEATLDENIVLKEKDKKQISS